MQVYREYTKNSDENLKRHMKIKDYFNAQRFLAKYDLVKSISYDSNNIEFFLFFGSKYLLVKD